MQCVCVCFKGMEKKKRGGEEEGMHRKHVSPSTMKLLVSIRILKHAD